MRVISGEAKGIQLRAPSAKWIRPTTNLAKEAIFSILEHNVSCWDRVLDLYAGSGALGIEALSRKAEWVDFVDRSRKCCIIIKHNLDKTGLSNKAHVYRCSASKSIAFLNNNYNIILMDPPYSDPYTTNLLTTLANSELTEENPTIVVCHANRFPLSSDYNEFYLAKQHRFGDTFISIYQKKDRP